MELLKDHPPRNPTLCLIQPHPCYEKEFSDNVASPETKMLEEGSSSERSTSVVRNFAVKLSPPSPLSSPSSTNSDGLGNQALKYQPEDGHNSLINFNVGYGNFANAAASFSFGCSQSSFPRIISNNQDDYSVWEDNLHYNYQNQMNSRCSSTPDDHRILENSHNIQTSSSYASTTSAGIHLGWLSTEANANATLKISIQDHGREEPCSINKRPSTGESTQASKKQCNVAKTLKSKSTAAASTSMDTQSVAAKNRRERISERLKILQDLVPNGSKVDLVTMLEKAISYVKFLQLQVKVLATDEFWPAHGAKAPDLSQVKEAIDAILASSQRHRNSTTSKS